MKNKKRKGFTLIELLAIIVILAIVAVITVPIILGIIEDASKKAAKASAYGYKDAINKYYLHRSLNDPNFEMQNKTYVVDANTGYLKYIDSANSQNNITHEIPIAGKIPNTGTVEINDNKIKKACLQFGDYAVPIENDEVGDAVKGICDGINIVEITSGQNIQGITAATTSTTTTTTTTTTTSSTNNTVFNPDEVCPGEGCLYSFVYEINDGKMPSPNMTSDMDVHDYYNGAIITSEDYNDLSYFGGYFAGLTKGNAGSIGRRYACAIIQGEVICAESGVDYSTNMASLQSEIDNYSEICTEYSSSDEYEYRCEDPNTGVYIQIGDPGTSVISGGSFSYDMCIVNENTVFCQLAF